MNVLLIPSYFPTRRELWRATYVYEYARSLALEHNVTVVYPQQLGSPGVGDEPFFIEERLAPRILLVNYTYSHWRKSWMLSYLSAFRRVLRRIKREWKIDLIFAHIVMPAGLAALLLKRLLHLPVLLTEHWGPAHDWLKWATVPRTLQYATLEHIYRKVDYLTAVSDSLANEISLLFGATAHGKLDYPIDCDLFHPGPSRPDATPGRVLCVTRGHFDPRKGVPNLLAAWEIVAQRTDGSVRLDIVGQDTNELVPQVEAGGIGRTCNLLPWMPPEELAPLMRSSALVVIPSVYETFGRSGAEALATGVPVVATRCGGPNEYMGEGGGLLVPSEDPRALAEGILAGLQRSNFLPPEELARRIRERFSYEAVCRRFNELAAGLTNGRK
jgi:glycosyltransferase involved in cell wall biosynthesis